MDHSVIGTRENVHTQHGRRGAKWGTGPPQTLVQCFRWGVHVAGLTVLCYCCGVIVLFVCRMQAATEGRGLRCFFSGFLGF